VSALLSLRSKKDSALVTKAKELVKNIVKFGDYISELRNFIVTAELAEKGDITKDMLGCAAAHLEGAQVHQSNMKTKLKIYKAVLA
jgi:hypothetical protein